MSCLREMKAAGGRYPRSCPRCGLGPCQAPAVVGGAEVVPRQEYSGGSRLMQLQQMLARDKDGAVFDMLYALRQWGVVKTLEAAYRIDARLHERVSDGELQYVRRNMAGHMVDAIEAAGLIEVTDDHSLAHNRPVTVKASLVIVVGLPS